ncbi:phosphoribosylamine--glycine ligase [candidate division KSB1 bacterium]
MKVLVVGSGGREHTLIWKIRQSPRVKQIVCAPGNGGIAELAECIPVAADDLDALVNTALERNIDLTVVGPEIPLAHGIVDLFKSRGLRIFGPTQQAAAIEGSKVFAKTIMKKYDIPTADFQTFDDPDAAIEYIETQSVPIVVKASGLAAGKGAIVCKTAEEARNAVREIMIDKTFGAAGDSIVIEECLVGEELSVFVLTDGRDYLMLPPSQDHKPIFNDDRGPNTGGMGAYAPAPLADEILLSEINSTIIGPVIDALRQEECPYTGLLYAGLMVTDDGPKVIEFNCRFGDPETQVVLPLIEEDIVDLLEATIDGTVAQCSIEPSKQYAVCVIIASDGYPGSYEKGKEIYGVDTVPPAKRSYIFHAGTKVQAGKLFTNGGRVLCMTATDFYLRNAIEKAYFLVESVHFEKMYYRTDIGKKGLARLSAS